MQKIEDLPLARALFSDVHSTMVLPLAVFWSYLVTGCEICVHLGTPWQRAHGASERRRPVPAPAP